MVSALKLIRGKVILLVIFIQLIMRYAVIDPILSLYGVELQLPIWAFGIYTLSICCAVAGAFTINDYFDYHSDRLSQVKNVVVGNEVSRRMTIVMHALFSALSVLLVAVLSVLTQIWLPTIITIVTISLLWVYSAYYKRSTWISNIVVAILGFFLPFALLLFEVPMLNRITIDVVSSVQWERMTIAILPYSIIFAINVYLYDLTKDLFTAKGDRECHYNSFVVCYGIERAKRRLILITAVVFIALLYQYIQQIDVVKITESTLFSIATILIPYLAYIVLLMKRSIKRTPILLMLKITMVASFARAFFFMI